MNTEVMWQRLQQNWQSARSAFDVSALVREAERKRRRMLATQTFEILMAFVATGFVIHAMIVGQWPGTSALAILLAIVWISVPAGLWMRRGSWRARGADPQALLRLARRRARAGLRFVWVNVAGLVLVYAVLAPWAWHGWEHGSRAVRAGIFASFLAQAVIFVAVVIWAFWYYRRQREKMRRAQALLKQLSDEDSNL